MKIRIKGASVRVRLSKSEVDRITTDGLIEEATPFINGTFVYALQRTNEGDQLSAGFESDRMTMYVPAGLIEDWATNSIISIDTTQALDDGRELYLLLEKDFQCLDHTTEDQSDNYINPNKNC